MSDKKPKCSIRPDWLSKSDPLGHPIHTWATKKSETQLFCGLCLCNIDCEAKGFQAINQHAKTIKHKANAKTKLNKAQMQIALVPSHPDKRQSGAQASIASTSSTSIASVNDSSNTDIRLIFNSSQNQVTIAELLWTMKCVSSNFSSASCDGIVELFKAMFGPGVPNDFSLSRHKMSYLQTECLGPFFRKIVVDEVQKAYYVICFDETTNNEGLKELQVSVRYWSDILEEVTFCHLETFFIGHATALILKDLLIKACQNADIPLCRMLMVACDGPNVNKSVIRQLNEAIKKDHPDFKGLLDIGTCNLHIVHNAFKKGLDEFGTDVSTFLLNIHAWFDHWPSRWEDFIVILRKMELPVHQTLKHVPSRWLSICGPGKRALEQWPAYVEYFLKFLPNKLKSSELSKKNKYSEIRACLKSPTMKAEIQFVIESAELFEKFSKCFQKNEPMIHILHSEIKTLLEILAGRICKREVVDKICSIKDPFSPENLLLFKEVKCGGDLTEKLLSSESLKEIDVLNFRRSVQNHFKAAATHLLNKSILCSSTAKHFRCLNPSKIKEETSLLSAERIAKALPININVSDLCDEWKLLQREKLPEWNSGRVDHFWRNIFKKKNPFNGIKYPNVVNLVKASLSLSHGSSDVERAFSVSSHVLTQDKTRMTERTLNAKLNIKSGLKFFGNKPELVPMTRDLLTSARFAYSKYKQYLETKKKQEETIANKKNQTEEDMKRRSDILKSQNKIRRDIVHLEKEVKKLHKAEEKEKHASATLLNEGSNKLKEALKKNDFNGARVAYGMISGAQDIRKNLETSKVKPLMQELEKKKSSLITSFLNSSKSALASKENDNPDDPPSFEELEF